jgi:hypothetical protein
MYKLTKQSWEVIDNYIISHNMTVKRDTRLTVAYRMMPIAFRDEDGNETGEYLFSYGIVARIAGKEGEALDKNFSTKQIKRLFEKLFPNDMLREGAHFSDMSRATSIIPSDLPDDLQEEVERILDGDYDNEPKICADDTVWTKAKTNAQRKQRRMEAQKEVGKAKSPQQKAMLDYLNNQAPRIHSDVEKMIPDMRNAMPAHIDRNVAAGQLISIEENPQQLYKVSENSLRIFPANTGLATEQKDMRRAATKKLGWKEFDLRNAGLAIAAYIYRNDPSIQENVIPLLSHNIWEVITEEFAIPLDSKTKKALKKAINKVINGGESAAAYWYAMKELQEQGYTVRNVQEETHETDKFWRLLISQNFAVDAKKEQIKKDGGITLPNGQKIKLVETDIIGKSKYNPNKKVVIGKRYNYGKLLSQEISYYEHLLIYPAFELATENKDRFAITLYQYDGFNVKFYERKDYWTQKIIETVNSNATAMGIQTQLIMGD